MMSGCGGGVQGRGTTQSPSAALTTHHPPPAVTPLPFSPLTLPTHPSASHPSPLTTHPCLSPSPVGGIPREGCTDDKLAEFFSTALTAIGGTSGPGDAVVSVYCNADKQFAFVEVREGWW